MNTLKIVFLMSVMMALFLAVGYFVGGQNGLIIAFLISLAMNFGSYWFSDKIVLMMYGAREVTEKEAPKLYRIVRNLVARNQFNMPRVYIIENESPNAFATGRNPQNSAVAATTGILRILDDNELEGVIGHELAHIQHRDILIGAIVATLVGTITFLARMAGWSMFFFGGDRDRDRGGLGELVTSLVLMIVAPIAAVMIQMAISRSREYEADKGGAQISGKPWALANALKKLHSGVQVLPMNDANPASAHMFIVNPFSGKGLMNLFSTHPPVEERIKRLNQLQYSGN